MFTDDGLVNFAEGGEEEMSRYVCVHVRQRRLLCGTQAVAVVDSGVVVQGVGSWSSCLGWVVLSEVSVRLPLLKLLRSRRSLSLRYTYRNLPAPGTVYGTVLSIVLV